MGEGARRLKKGEGGAFVSMTCFNHSPHHQCSFAASCFLRFVQQQLSEKIVLAILRSERLAPKHRLQSEFQVFLEKKKTAEWFTLLSPFNRLLRGTLNEIGEINCFTHRQCSSTISLVSQSLPTMNKALSTHRPILYIDL